MQRSNSLEEVYSRITGIGMSCSEWVQAQVFWNTMQSSFRYLKYKYSPRYLKLLVIISTVIKLGIFGFIVSTGKLYVELEGKICTIRHFSCLKQHNIAIAMHWSTICQMFSVLHPRTSNQTEKVDATFSGTNWSQIVWLKKWYDDVALTYTPSFSHLKKLKKLNSSGYIKSHSNGQIDHVTNPKTKHT